ncbi:uncharacterized protein LOC127719978 [Mytilus californianus]|uniref:uncharacterized protein LOC127719978 n=1 Tax=Mytilus californianus TaxID=6549 RepID=UPI00224708C6|nr:uncharacterized protein LOC127719978 [Mytilus californianus]
MIIYVENKAFPFRTFVTLVDPTDKIARVRAHLLHSLHEIGREDHQFRLRFKGQYLRDAFYLEDYDIGENAVVKMVPMSKRNDSVYDLKSLTSSTTLNLDLGPGQTEDVKSALYRELKGFCFREKLISDFSGLMYMHFLAACLTLLTTYWYSFSWTFPLFLIGVIFCPQFTRIGGYVGNYTHWKYVFCVVYAVGALATLGVSLYFSSVQWMSIVNHGCKDWVFVDACSHKHVFTAIFFSFNSLLLLGAAIIVAILFFNFRLQIGDYIEKFLVQERDIEDVMKAARNGKLKEKRTAAYELAAMAASGDDNKFRIVAEDGLEVLLSLALSSDDSTQEHAVEAIEELLIIPSIQDNFVEMGGVKTLTALLRSENSKVMQEAASALYTIVSESDEHNEHKSSNQSAVVADHGIDDLAYASHQGTIYCQRTVASIFLELAFNRDIRAQLASRNIPAQAMTHLCRSNDPETQRYALQTLELLAIESSDMICAQEELLDILLELPLKTMDEKLYLIAGKILLYYAENKATCKQLVENPSLKESLTIFARTQNAVLQKVVAKVIFCTTEHKGIKSKAKQIRLDKVLGYIRDNAADREAWDMADQGLQAMNCDDDNLSTLPTLSTLEKLNKMGSKEQFGSKTSLGSDVKPSGSSSD